MNKTVEYLSYIEDSLKLEDGSSEEMHKRLIKIWARLSEYLYYSDVTFEKFNREMGYDHFDECSSEEVESEEESSSLSEEGDYENEETANKESEDEF